MRRHTLHRPQRGMSLVELLVATVISLLGVLIIFQVFAVNEGVRRTTTSGSDEQTSGLMALMTFERNLRHAGFGINDFDLVGCNMRTYDAERTPNAVPDYPLAPVQIVSNAGTVPDVVRVIYGGSKHTTAAVQFLDLKTIADPVELIYRFGFDPGDVVVVGEKGSNCTLMEVTNPQAATGDVNLEHSISSYSFKNGSSTTTKVPRFNDPAGFPQTYKYPLAKALNLGPFPVYAEITVRNAEVNPRDNNQLVMQNLWGEAAQPEPVAEQIVQLKAEYGMDDKNNNGTVARAVYNENDNLVDNFTPNGPDPTKPEQWAQVRSVRVAIVSRSLTPDKPPCNATPAFSADVNDDTYPMR
jgi:type IV pilus assembly protein PilW